MKNKGHQIFRLFYCVPYFHFRNLQQDSSSYICSLDFVDRNIALLEGLLFLVLRIEKVGTDCHQAVLGCPFSDPCTNLSVAPMRPVLWLCRLSLWAFFRFSRCWSQQNKDIAVIARLRGWCRRQIRHDLLNAITLRVSEGRTR